MDLHLALVVVEVQVIARLEDPQEIFTLGKEEEVLVLMEAMERQIMAEEEEEVLVVMVF
jgi:hypothetical protein